MPKQPQVKGYLQDKITRAGYKFFKGNIGETQYKFNITSIKFENNPDALILNIEGSARNEKNYLADRKYSLRFDLTKVTTSNATSRTITLTLPPYQIGARALGLSTIILSK
jgi:hypothetical protein